MATATKPRKQKKADPIPKNFRIMEAAADSEFQIEAAEGDEKKLRKFSMVAYTGGPMQLGFGYPVVVDLAGLSISAKPRPILRDHNRSQIVGHTTEISSAGGIRLKGVISAANEHAIEVQASADNGFPWQSSIGASAEQVVFLDKGEKTQVNGKTITGPAYIARKATLKEVSFVALGADDDTTAKIAATAGGLVAQVQSEIKRLRDAGMTITAIAKNVNRLPKTLTAIENGQCEVVPRSLHEKLKRVRKS